MDRTTVVSTPRLRVTTWLDGDLDDLHQLHSDPEVMRFLRGGLPESRAQTAARLARYRREQADLGWTKWRVEDSGGVMIGRGGFGQFPGGRELGFALLRSVWGAGLATELARVLVRWHLEHPLDTGGSLRAFAVEGNRASRRVLEKTGFAVTDVRDHNGRPHAFYELTGDGSQQRRRARPGSRPRPQVRAVSLADADDMERLFATLGYPARAPEIRDRLARLLSDPTYACWVVVHGGLLAGFAAGHLLWPVEDDRPAAQLIALATAPEHQGVGAGTALIRKFETWASSRGAQRVLVNSGAHRHDAHAFYERCGYLASGVRFTRLLADD